VRAWAYEFACAKSLYEMEPLLHQAGPWRWAIKDCAWYPDFLQSRRPDGGRICVYAVDPPDGRVYRAYLEAGPSAPGGRSAVDPVFRGLLARLPVTGLREIEAVDWPFD
jgi:hypothetical protein